MENESHDRKSIRLKGFDYCNQAIFFVTICTAERKPIFGSIDETGLHLNEVGKAVANVWYEFSMHFPGYCFDAFIVMPNHIHGVLANVEEDIENRIELGKVIAVFKSYSTKVVKQLLRDSSSALWQRGFFDRIIRSEFELNAIRNYIINNPLLWLQRRDIEPNDRDFIKTITQM